MGRKISYGLKATIIATLWLGLSELLGFELISNETYNTWQWTTYVFITWCAGYAVVRLYEYYFGMPWTKKKE